MFSPSLLQDYLLLSTKRYPAKEALICGKERWTYSSIDQYSNRLARALVNIGLKCQDRVVIFLHNSSEAVISIYGTVKANGIFVILNGLMKAKKLAYVLKNSGARVLITHTTKAKIVAEAFNGSDIECKIIWVGSQSAIPKTLSSISESWQAIFSNIATVKQDLENIKFNKDKSNGIDLDLAALVYTSASTGEPKGVMCSHQNMITAASSIIQYLENNDHDIILNVLPLSFDYGLYQVIMAFMFGGTVVLEKSFTFVHNVLMLIKQEKVTGFPIVPTIAAMILKLQDLKKYDLGSLRYITNTGAALPVEHILRLKKLFPQVKLYSMFGLTECKRVCYLPPEELDRRPLSVGKPMPNCEVFILNEAGKEVGPGEEGELVIRGSNVMKGYWKDPELTAKYFHPGRYPGELLLYSGDYFRKDSEGFLYFLGRKDDMIKSRGERISPKEVENVIYKMKGILEVAVIGVPDEILGQAIIAFIVKDNGAQFTEKAILKHCSDYLEPFAVPKGIKFVAELPKTAHGKIDKLALKVIEGL